MSTLESDLWDKVKAYHIGVSGAEFSFSDRLARENGWTLKYALRVIFEYKRFMFLISILDETLTPSDQVDQAWHLHLLYTHDYWNSFCKEILEREIHHGPTKGGEKEKENYSTLYENTLKRYQEVFTEAPPNDIWPSVRERFTKIDFIRIAKDDYILISKDYFKMFNLWRYLKN